MTATPTARRWIDHLNDEDVAFLKRFILLSGSLKDTAAAYGISYPTVRLRLDRLIDKVRLLDSNEIGDTFEVALRLLLADGKLDESSFRALLEAHREAVGRNA